MKIKTLTLIVTGAMITLASGLWAADATVTRVVTRAATRVDPIAVAVVPVVVATPVAAPVVPEVVAVTDTTDDVLAGRPTRPPIIDTRSPGRPAPITPIPR